MCVNVCICESVSVESPWVALAEAGKKIWVESSGMERLGMGPWRSEEEGTWVQPLSVSVETGICSPFAAFPTAGKAGKAEPKATLQRMCGLPGREAGSCFVLPFPVISNPCSLTDCPYYPKGCVVCSLAPVLPDAVSLLSFCASLHRELA